MYRYALLSLVFVILRSNGHQRGSQGLLGDDLAVYYLGRDPVAEALVKCGWLKPEDEGNREKIAEAVEALVDDFTEGRLVPAGDA